MYLKQKYILHLIILVIVSIMSVSCKEDVDTERPGIEIIHPTEHDVFAFGDTVLLIANFTDNELIKEVQIVLINNNNEAVLNLVKFRPGKKDFYLNQEFIFDDPYLLGGQYKLRYIATDGTNSNSISIDVLYSDVPVEYAGLLVTTIIENSNHSIYRLPADSNAKKVFDWDADFCASECSSRYKLIYLCSNNSKGVSAFNYYNGKPSWNAKPQSNGFDFGFVNMQSAFSGLLMCQYDPAEIIILNHQGQKVFGSDKTTLSRPRCATELKEMVVGYYENDITQDRYLNVYSRSGGGLIKSIIPDMKILDISEIATYIVLLSGNTLDSKGWIGKLYLYGNSISTLYTFTDEKMVDVCQLSSERFVVSTNQGIYIYQVSNNSLSPINSQIKNAILEYDAVSDQVFAAAGTKIYSLIPKQGNFNLLESMSKTIVDIKPYYTK